MQKMQLALMVLSCACIAAANELIITSSNVDEVIGGDKHIFVKYHAPNCETCIQFEPVWNKLSQQYASDPTLAFGTIDCSVEVDLCKVQGYRLLPALTYFSIESTVAENYIGKMEEEMVTQFVVNSTAPQCTFARLDVCNEKQREWMDNNTNIELHEINKMVEDRESDMEKVDEAFDKYKEDLQKQLKTAAEKYVKWVDEKNLQLKWFRAIRRELNATIAEHVKVEL